MISVALLLFPGLGLALLGCKTVACLFYIASADTVLEVFKATVPFSLLLLQCLTSSYDINRRSGTNIPLRKTHKIYITMNREMYGVGTNQSGLEGVLWMGGLGGLVVLTGWGLVKRVLGQWICIGCLDLVGFI